MPVFVSFQTSPSSNEELIPDTTTLFYIGLDCRFTEIKCNIRGKSIHKVTQDSNIYTGNLSNKTM